ncbi:hypothetical protein RRG08_018463 [Elysia crispata]|uniref:Uncharacterized protein n=1 Tax=Elysia crispata TaxID=231223 RepID=A0AAE0YT02_9GAST|nr:hypothetical protein RRG08_018463 [Elysia crispata]
MCCEVLEIVPHDLIHNRNCNCKALASVHHLQQQFSIWRSTGCILLQVSDGQLQGVPADDKGAYIVMFLVFLQRICSQSCDLNLSLLANQKPVQGWLALTLK